MKNNFDKSIDKHTQIVKIFKRNGLWGDFIVARRLFPDKYFAIPNCTNLSYVARNVIDISLIWSRTPQGSGFWNDIYRKIH